MIDHTVLLGGAEYSLECLVKGMDSTRYRYTVVLPGPGPFADRLNALGVSVDYMRVDSWRWWVRTIRQRLKFFATIPYQVANLIRWIKYLKKKKPDIIHFNINRLVEPVIAAKILGIPSVMHFRDIPSRIDQKFILGMKGFYWLMGMADIWIANSKSTYDDINCNFDRKTIEVPNGVDLSLYSSRSIKHHKDEDSKITVAMIALLVPWKNHIGLLKVISLVTNQYKNIVFLIVGEGDKGYSNKLQEQITEYGIEEYVKLTGYVDNIPNLLSSVDILIHTTEREPFGRVFIEAMSACKPVVAFDSGGAAEIVVNGETGILVPKGEIGKMAEEISSLINNPDMREQMGKAGRTRVEKYYTIDKHCQKVAEIYNDLL